MIQGLVEVFIAWLKANIRAIALTAAGTLLIMQFVLPSLFDSLVSVTLLGLGWVIGKTQVSQ